MAISVSYLLGCSDPPTKEAPKAPAPKPSKAPQPKTEELLLDADQPVKSQWGPSFELELVSHKHGVGFTAGDYRLTMQGPEGEESFEFRVTNRRDWFGEKMAFGRLVRLSGRNAESRLRIILPAKTSTSPPELEVLVDSLEQDPRIVEAMKLHGGPGTTRGRHEDWGAHEVSYSVADGSGDVVVRVGAISGEVLDVSFQERKLPQLKTKKSR